jgi:hypothetical protein
MIINKSFSNKAEAGVKKVNVLLSVLFFLLVSVSIVNGQGQSRSPAFQPAATPGSMLSDDERYIFDKLNEHRDRYGQDDSKQPLKESVLLNTAAENIAEKAFPDGCTYHLSGPPAGYPGEVEVLFRCGIEVITLDIALDDFRTEENNPLFNRLFQAMGVAVRPNPDATKGGYVVVVLLGTAEDPTPIPTPTPIITFTPSYTPTPTSTFTPSYTPTITDTPTPTDTPTVTPTFTDTPTNTPTATFTTTPLPTETPTNTPPPTQTPTPTPTLPPTATPLPTETPPPTPTSTLTFTPFPTITPFPTSTPPPGIVNLVLMYPDPNYFAIRIDAHTSETPIYLHGLRFSTTSPNNKEIGVSVGSLHMLDSVLDNAQPGDCIVFYVGLAPTQVPPCEMAHTYAIPLENPAEQRFWLEEMILFTVFQGQQAIGNCPNSANQQTCTVSWTNSIDNRQYAGGHMVWEWTSPDYILLRFETLRPTINLSNIRIVVQVKPGQPPEERYYRLDLFTKLQALSFYPTAVPATACLALASRTGVISPQDNRCSAIYFDDGGVPSVGSEPFWGPPFEYFEIRLYESDSNRHSVLGRCPFDKDGPQYTGLCEVDLH